MNIIKKQMLKNAGRMLSAPMKVSSLITTVRIKGGMKSEDLSSHVLYVSGQNNTKGNRTGANTMLICSQIWIVEDVDGVVKIAAPTEEEPILIEKQVEKKALGDGPNLPPPSPNKSTTIQIPSLATTHRLPSTFNFIFLKLTMLRYMKNYLKHLKIIC